MSTLLLNVCSFSTVLLLPFCCPKPSQCRLTFPQPTSSWYSIYVYSHLAVTVHASLSLSVETKPIQKLWSFTLAFCVLRMLHWIIFYCPLIVYNMPENGCKVPMFNLHLLQETRRPLYRSSSSRTHITCVLFVCFLCANMKLLPVAMFIQAQ